MTGGRGATLCFRSSRVHCYRVALEAGIYAAVRSERPLCLRVLQLKNKFSCALLTFSSILLYIFQEVVILVTMNRENLLKSSHLQYTIEDNWSVCVNILITDSNFYLFGTVQDYVSSSVENSCQDDQDRCSSV